jgi:hypothetical protein
VNFSDKYLTPSEEESEPEQLKVPTPVKTTVLPQNLTSSQKLLPSGKEEEEEDNYSDFDSEGGKKPRTTVYKPAPTPISPVHSAKTTPHTSDVLPETLSSTHELKKDHISSAAHESSDLFPKGKSSSHSSSGSGQMSEIPQEIPTNISEHAAEQSFHSAVESDHTLQSDHSPAQIAHLSIEPEQHGSTHSAHSTRTSPHASEAQQELLLSATQLPEPAALSDHALQSAHSIAEQQELSADTLPEQIFTYPQPVVLQPTPAPKNEPSYASFVTREQPEQAQEPLGPPTRIYDGNTGE